VSIAKYPILASAIPIYDWLMNKLEEFKMQTGRSAEMLKAMDMGFAKLKQYYEKSDDSHMYAITTSKASYFFFFFFYKKKKKKKKRKKRVLEN
jgi:hypothetical protein